MCRLNAELRGESDSQSPCVAALHPSVFVFKFLRAKRRAAFLGRLLSVPPSIVERGRKRGDGYILLMFCTYYEYHCTKSVPKLFF